MHEDEPDELSDAERDELRGALGALRDRLEAALAAGADGAAVVELDQTKMGRVSRVDAMQQQAMAQRTRQQQERRLALVRTALGRVDDELFGLCATCEEPIGLRRLRVRPEATLCLACARARE